MVERGFSARAQKWSAEFAKENKAGAEAYQEADFREAYQEAESWYRAEFREKTKTELERAGITDQTFPLATGIQQQTENASEFNVDKISLQDLQKHVMEELSEELDSAQLRKLKHALAAPAVWLYHNGPPYSRNL